MKTIQLSIKNNRGEKIELELSIGKYQVGKHGAVTRNRRLIVISKSSVPVELGLIEGTNGRRLDFKSFWQTTGDINRMKTYPVKIYANGDKTRNGAFKLFSTEWPGE